MESATKGKARKAKRYLTNKRVSSGESMSILTPKYRPIWFRNPIILKEMRKYR
jgi:hypothetical protein